MVSGEVSQLPAMIDDVVRKVVAGYAPERIILFGSYARGEAGAESDIDLLIIKDTDKRPIERWMDVKRIVRDRRRRACVSPLGDTRQELEARLSMKDFFIREGLREGRVLYTTSR